jgi:5S rRNA maturation endonuclease (ribonuclease M5)
MMSEKRILKILEKYRVKNSRTPIVVEGKNDVASLRKLSFEGEIIQLNSGSSLLDFSETLGRSYKEIIILTDFDRKGMELKHRIEAYLVGSGCTVDSFLWNSLRKSMPVRTVEELPFATKRIAGASIN